MGNTHCRFIFCCPMVVDREISVYKFQRAHVADVSDGNCSLSGISLESGVAGGILPTDCSLVSVDFTELLG